MEIDCVSSCISCISIEKGVSEFSFNGYWILSFDCLSGTKSFLGELLKKFQFQKCCRVDVIVQ